MTKQLGDTLWCFFDHNEQPPYIYESVIGIIETRKTLEDPEGYISYGITTETNGTPFGCNILHSNLNKCAFTTKEQALKSPEYKQFIEDNIKHRKRQINATKENCKNLKIKKEYLKEFTEELKKNQEILNSL